MKVAFFPLLLCAIYSVRARLPDPDTDLQPGSGTGAAFYLSEKMNDICGQWNRKCQEIYEDAEEEKKSYQSSCAWEYFHSWYFGDEADSGEVKFGYDVKGELPEWDSDSQSWSYLEPSNTWSPRPLNSSSSLSSPSRRRSTDIMSPWNERCLGKLCSEDSGLALGKRDEDGCRGYCEPSYSPASRETPRRDASEIGSLRVYVEASCLITTYDQVAERGDDCGKKLGWTPYPNQHRF